MLLVAPVQVHLGDAALFARDHRLLGARERRSRHLPGVRGA